MIVWGGYVVRGQSKVWQNSGAIYDLETNKWQPLTPPASPSELNDLSIEDRPVQTLVWTGKEVIAFGGAPVNGKLTGGIYDPTSKSWRSIALSGAPVRIGGHTATWAEDRMIVWGGLDANRSRTASGASFDPKTNSWKALPTADAPRPRDAHAAVWTGEKLVVFGGFESVNEINGTGSVYDPATNTWTPMSAESVPSRVGHTAVWTGSEMLVFGGKFKRTRAFLAAVSAYNPSTNAWRTIEASGSPNALEARQHHVAVFTGNGMLVHGGRNEAGYALGTGGLYLP
jgi:N-acetylneuraminic acid mutarotase